MNCIRRRGAALYLTAVFAAGGILLNTDALAANGNGPYVGAMPAFKLKDPVEKEHSESQLKGKPSVVLLTIPNVKHGDWQSRWSRWLTKKGWPEEVNFVLVQDMSQSNVKEKARASMKKKFKPEKMPLLLLDETGEVRRSFQVRNDETVLLIFNKEGKVVHFCDQKPTIEEARKIKKMVDQMKG